MQTRADLNNLLDQADAAKSDVALAVQNKSDADAAVVIATAKAGAAAQQLTDATATEREKVAAVNAAIAEIYGS